MPLNELVHHVVSVNYSAEHRVMTVKMRLRRVSDEILAAAGIGSGERHPDRSALVAVAIHLVAYGVTGAAVSIIPWVAILCNEVWNHSMKACIPIVPGPREVEKVPYGNGSISAEQLETNWSAHSIDGRVHGLPDVRRHHDGTHHSFIPRAGPRGGCDTSPSGPKGYRLSSSSLERIGRHRSTGKLSLPRGVERAAVLFPQRADILYRREPRVVRRIAARLTVAGEHRREVGRGWPIRKRADYGRTNVEIGIPQAAHQERMDAVLERHSRWRSNCRVRRLAHSWIGVPRERNR